MPPGPPPTPDAVRQALLAHAMRSAPVPPPGALRSRVWQAARLALPHAAAPDRGARPTTDPALLDALRRGEAWPVDALYTRYAGQLLGYARRHLDGHEAESAAFDAFATLARKGRELRGDSNLRALLFHFARAAVADAERRRMRYREDPAGDGLPEVAAEDDPLARLLAREDLDTVARKLDEGCTPLEQDVLLLTAEGHAASEIAATLGVKEDHVRQLRTRGRRALRAASREEEVA